MNSTSKLATQTKAYWVLSKNYSLKLAQAPQIISYAEVRGELAVSERLRKRYEELGIRAEREQNATVRPLPE